MRYQFTNIEKRFDGKNVYKSTYYPTISFSDDDVYIVAGDGEYLDSLAYKYYGNEAYWWIIARANNLGFGRLSIEKGKQIRIPQNITAIIQNLKNIN